MRRLPRVLLAGAGYGSLLLLALASLARTNRALADGPAMGGEAPRPRLPAELARRFAELDRDGSGRLAPAEWPFGAESFRPADRDGDGALSPGEVVRSHALDEARRKGTPGRELRAKFREGDKDQDGAITRAEFQLPESLFERFDRDGDGRVTFPEALHVAMEEEVAKSYALHDADLSGALSYDETPAEHKDGFVAGDADEDGQLTGAEAHALLMELALAADAGPAGAGRAQGEAMAPGATPGAATPGARPVAGVPGATAAHPAQSAVANLLERLGTLDRDGDGRVARDELGVSQALFTRCDVDHDGAVDAHELRLRLRRGQAAIARAEQLKARGKRLGLQDGGAPALVAEALGLLAAGRVEELETILDELELLLDRLEAR